MHTAVWQRLESSLRAGNSQTRWRRTGCTWNHPRACGEQLEQMDLQTLAEGSPPRVRGAAIDVPKASIAPGIIPAHAGNSHKGRACSRGLRDHPRACGEQVPWSTYTSSLVGSSPRARGTSLAGLRVLPAVGIIPARAGSSLSAAESSRRARGHPRVCGEQSLSSNKNLQVQGSSPRVRGAAGPHRLPSRQPGIIPACAGSRPIVPLVAI